MLTDEQKAQRVKGLGGSDAPVVAGLSPYKTALQLYYEKRGELPISEEETEEQYWGKVLEKPIADAYAKRTGRKIREQPIKFSTTIPFMLANIDRQIMKDPRGPGILEVKAPGYWPGKDLRGADDIPDHFYIQGQHYLKVYGYQWCSFAILVGGQRFLWFDVERHEGVIAQLVEIEGEFWERVQTGNPPSPDGSPATRELFKRLYPQDTGKVVTLETPEFVKAAADFIYYRDLEKAVETDKAECENTLKAAMADASEAIIPGFGKVTWKCPAPSLQEFVDIEKLRAEFPDAAAACIQKKPRSTGRRFLAKPDKALVPKEAQ